MLYKFLMKLSSIEQFVVEKCNDFNFVVENL
jgi:hypothetical protein